MWLGRKVKTDFNKGIKSNDFEYEVYPTEF